MLPWTVYYLTLDNFEPLVSQTKICDPRDFDCKPNCIYVIISLH